MRAASVHLHRSHFLGYTPPRRLRIPPSAQECRHRLPGAPDLPPLSVSPISAETQAGAGAEKCAWRVCALSRMVSSLLAARSRIITKEETLNCVLDCTSGKRSSPVSLTVRPPHPSPLPRKLALASLHLWCVRIRKRMRMGEGVRSRTLQRRSLSLGERDRVRGCAVGVRACLAE